MDIRDALYGLANLAFDVWLETKKGAKIGIMDVKLGTLNISPAKRRLDLLAESVQKAIATLPDIDGVGVVEIDPNLSDTVAFCEHYQVDMNQAANCVVLEAKRADKTLSLEATPPVFLKK